MSDASAFADDADSESEGEELGRWAQEFVVTAEEIEQSRFRGDVIPPVPSLPSHLLSASSAEPLVTHDPAPLLSPPAMSQLLAKGSARDTNFYQQAGASASTLSLQSVVGDRTDLKLQKVDPFFTDSTGEFYRGFEKRLGGLSGKNSEKELCIEEFLVKSEKEWFEKYRHARLGVMDRSNTPLSTPNRSRRNSATSMMTGFDRPSSALSNLAPTFRSDDDEFLLGKDYIPVSGLKKHLQRKVGDWPAYSLLLAFGQVIAANSYQVTLLTGEVGQSAEKLYVVSSIYLVTSIIWWFLFRSVKATYVLSLPFLFYGLAFMFVGLSPFVPMGPPRSWMQRVGTACYAGASSSGSLYFALNFGDEGGAPVKDWVFRACCIQGTQQIYVVALWYWGSVITKTTAVSSSAGGTTTNSLSSNPVLAAATLPIACLLWTIGLLILLGLPDYYRQAPGAVPSFYKAVLRRRIILWFFVAVIVQNYFLSASYGRNWSYLWSSRHAPTWAIVLLIILFFIVLWALFLWVMARLSARHSWILPIFAIGLGAPRWCQLLWGISGIGAYVPWAGTPVSSALLGRSLWLWLGLLDTIQGVGLGMVLLQTLTRIHVAFTLIAAQVFGSAATMLARASAPNKIGPGEAFPDFSQGASYGLSFAWFWVTLIAQLLICAGFFKFFRNEQLSKP